MTPTTTLARSPQPAVSRIPESAHPSSPSPKVRPMDSLRITHVPDRAPDAAEAPQRILVVDDLPEICMIFRDIHRRFRHLKVDLVTETNSQRALELAQQERFDVVVSDFRMKQVDGIEILKAANQANPKGYRVLMTGYNEIPTSVARIREACVDAYVQKPLHAQELLLLLLGLVKHDESLITENRAHARELEQQGESNAVSLG